MPTIDIEKIRHNDTLRNEFISDYRPFIANCVYSIVNHRVEYGVDEELSIALLAFNHAIDRFDGRGSFLSFAKLVIKNRLFDYYRHMNRHGGHEPLQNDDDTENANVIDRSVMIHKDDSEASELREEIADFSTRLKSLGINFLELSKISPKHKNKRKKLNEIVNYILNDQTAQQFYKSTNNIPLKLIEDNLGISRKNIEPYRKYLVALIVVASSDYYFLKEYLSL